VSSVSSSSSFHPIVCRLRVEGATAAPIHACDHPEGV
jgi:hypothetical protein